MKACHAALEPVASSCSASLVAVWVAASGAIYVISLMGRGESLGLRRSIMRLRRMA